jgi:outer membrane protein assembly factor BamD (BamD/ComL family)
LREESAAVLAIRKTLLAGDASEALRMLDRASAEFQGGALVQEREALTVRALVESGQKEAARRRAEAFLRAFPRSPHAAEVRALVGP